MSSSLSPSSSEVKNSATTDIDNNIQDEAKSSPAPTPTRKRMSRAEKARLESEELLKSLGVSIDSGRQTRSSRRGGRVESPKPEPPPTPKRKAAPSATPSRRGKKAKVEENSDQTDHGSNHVEEESHADEKQSAQPTDNSKVSEEVDESPAQPVAEVPAASQKASEAVQQMEVDEDTPQPIESSKQSAEVAPSSPPPAESAASPPPPQALSSHSEPSQVEESSPSPDQEATPAVVDDSQQNEIAAPQSALTAAVADTTTSAIVIDSESQETIDASCEAASQNIQDEPIELVSSPSSDVEAKTQQQQQTQQVTTNTQTICTSQSDAIVDLDTSSNEGDDVKEVTDSSSDIVCSQRPPQQQTQDLDTLDLELINSDSDENEVICAYKPAPSPPLTQSVQDAPIQPTSTVQSDVVEIDIDANESSADVAANNADQRNNINADAAAENSVVESTDQQKPIEIPENICTITVNTPVEETITTTSEQLLPQSNVTTA